MARTYGYALAGALIATFTVTPVLASFLLPQRVQEAETLIVRALHRVYTPALRYALANQRNVVAAGGAFLAIAALLLPRLGSEFLPQLEEGNYWIRASMPTTLSLEDGEAATRRMRLILMRHPEVVTVVSQHGRPDDGSDAAPFSNVELVAPLKPADRPAEPDREKLTAEIQSELERGSRRRLQLLPVHRGQREEAMSGVKGVNSVKIKSVPNLQTLTELATRVRDQARAGPW